jgi:hypothetical protein
MTPTPNQHYGKQTMTTTSEIQVRNRELARAINEEARRDRQSPYAGKWVGIANGQVAVVADTLSEMAKQLRQIEPDPQRTFGVQASRDYSKVIYVWGMR